VGLVHVKQGVVPLLHLDEGRQIGVVTVHAVDALDRDHDPAVLAAEVAKQAIELMVIVVAKRPLASLGRRRPLHDAVVGQFVVEDQVFCAEEMTEERCVGAVAAWKHDGPLRADEGGELPVERLQNRIVTPHHPAGRCAAAEAVDRLLGGPGHVRVAGEAEVVEARVAHHLAAGDAGHAALHRLVGEQERVLEAGCGQPREAILEGAAFGKRIGGIEGRGAGQIAGSGWLQGPAGLRPTGGGRSRDSPRRRRRSRPVDRVEHVGGDTIDQIVAGIDVAEPVGMKPHLIAALDASDGVEEARLVDAGVGEGTTRREPGTAFRRGDPLQFLQHEPRDRQPRMSPGPVTHVARPARLPAGHRLAEPHVDRCHDMNPLTTRRVRPASAALYGNQTHAARGPT